MPGKDFQVSEQEVKDFLSDQYPGAMVLSRRDSNTESVAYYPESGYVIARAGSNKKLIAKMTDPDFTPEYKESGRLLDVPPQIQVKSHCQNLANRVIGLLNEIQAASQKKPIIKYDEDGRITAVKTGDITYKKNKTHVK